MNQLYPSDSKDLRCVYREYPQRWLQLFLFVSALISNVIFGFSLSPIAQEISTIYSINNKVIQFLTVSFTIFSCVMVIPGNIINEKYGIRSCVVIGCMLTLVGSLLAVFINISFWFFFAGQLISLIGFPFRLIAASKFTANWFFPENRIMIMVIISLLFNASSGLAVRLPLWIMGDYNDKDDQANDYEEGKNLVEALVIVLMILMVFLTVPPILLFRSKPATPPSFTASEECQRESYLKAGKALLSNRDYLILTVCFPFILGTITLFTLQMEYIIRPFGFDLKDISNAVGLGVLAGLIGDVCVGTAVKKTQSYKMVLRLCNFLVTIFFILMAISLFLENKPFFFFSYFSVCGCSAILALTFEFSCELSFPVSENSTIAFLGLFGNLLNFLQSIPEVLILKVLIAVGNSKLCSIITLIFMGTLVTSANYFCTLIDEKLKRSEQDKERDLRDPDTPDSQSLQSLESPLIPRGINS